MSAIFEIIVFLVFTMTMILNAVDNVYLGDYTVLDLFLSLVYLEITFWGLFSLISVNKTDIVGVGSYDTEDYDQVRKDVER